jgi:hypothetical protein
METSFYITSGFKEPVKLIEQMQKIILSLFILSCYNCKLEHKKNGALHHPTARCNWYLPNNGGSLSTPYKPAAQR